MNAHSKSLLIDGKYCLTISKCLHWWQNEVKCIKMWNEHDFNTKDMVSTKDPSSHHSSYTYEAVLQWVPYMCLRILVFFHTSKHKHHGVIFCSALNPVTNWRNHGEEGVTNRRLETRNTRTTSLGPSFISYLNCLYQSPPNGGLL